MEKRLCCCKSCRKFFMIDPSRPCPKCGSALLASVVTESEWNRSSAQQKEAYKATLSGAPYAAGYSAPPRSETPPRTETPPRYTTPPRPAYGYSDDIQKKLKSYRSWSIAIGVVGILSFLFLLGQYAQIEAQGYMISDKTPMYLGCALSILCAAAGFYGMGVPKQPSRLNTSWILFIVVVIGMGLLAVAYQMTPGWLCAAGCILNIINGSKLKKVL